jgi:hypothetical protein
MLKRLGRLLAGEDFLLLPEFSLPDTAGIKATFNDQELTASVKESNLREWIQGLALVRDNIRSFQMIGNLRKIYGAAADKRNLKILQLPHLPGGGNHWIGGRFPEGFEPPAGATSLAFEFSAGFTEDEKISGILVDEWREKIPLPEITGGIAIHYNQANSEAPQCMLLAVSPTQKGAWDWENLAGSVIETMKMAKKRAVDTEILQTSWVSQFLPALVTPVDDRNNTPNLNFGVAGPGLKIPPVFRPDIVGGGGGVIARF